MTQKVKITPRAARLAKEKGLDAGSLAVKGTGYGGGICEKDILSYLKSNPVKASEKATPLARKVAEANGILLSEISGTGIRGKIRKTDVTVKLKEGRETGPAAFVSGRPGVMPVTQSPGGIAEADTGRKEMTEDGKEIGRVVPYAGVRRIIGERLSHSMFTAPHLYFTQKVNLKKLLNLRKEVNATQEKKTSVTDYIALACVKTLQKYPAMNASLEGDRIYEYGSINLGIAVAAPAGLIVPVVKSAEGKKLLEISGEAAVLFEKARNGRLTPDEYSGGTFTVSNLGMFGIENFTAIINPPEAGILAVSATKDEPFAESDGQGGKKISIRPMMNITLSVDHRLIDGLLAAQFVTEVKRLLESPIELMI